MGLVALLVLVLTLVPAAALLVGGLHLVRQQASRAYGLGVGLLVLAGILGSFGVLTVIAVVQSVA